MTNGLNTGARTTTSGPGGEFRFLNLDPGNYTISVALGGFATTQRTVTVSAGVSVEVSAHAEEVARRLQKTRPPSLATIR